MMMSKQKNYYTNKRLKSTGADIYLLVGERSNGKSYSVKHEEGILPYFNGGIEYISSYKDKEKVIEQSFKAGRRFIYLRRTEEELTAYNVEKYFDDVDIWHITNGRYSGVKMFGRKIYFTRYDEEKDKSIRCDEFIGYARSLASEQNSAGGSYLDVYTIIFEEFMARGNGKQLNPYLYQESDRLMNFFSTIDRKRHVVKMWLIGNNITRVNPYLTDWGLQKEIRSMKQGDIREMWLTTGTFDDDGEEIFIKLAIEWAEDSGDSSFVIGRHKDMLNKGDWQSDPQPKLPKSINEYKKLYEIIFKYDDFKFKAWYVQDKETFIPSWFIYPYDGDIPERTFVISNEIKPSQYWQRDLYNPTIKNEKLKNLFNTFRESNVFYASDLCGTEFKQAIDFQIKK